MEHTVAWLSAMPNWFDGTDCGRDKIYDNLSLRYGMKPKGLLIHFDRCSEGFTVEHGIGYKKGGLVGQRHDNIHDELAHLCPIALIE